MRFLADISEALPSQPDMAEKAVSSKILALRLLHGLPDHTRNAVLRRISGLRTVPAGRDIVSQGEPFQCLYSIVDGWVMLYTLMEDGRRQILEFCPPGSMIGGCASHNAVATYGIQPLTKATICAIDYDDLDTLMNGHPAFAIHLIREMARDREMAFGRLASIGRQSARERVARLLLELFTGRDGQGQDTDDEPMFLPLTQEHIGDAMGLTGVHVNRVLRELKDEGILCFHYRRLQVMDLERLIEAADMDSGQVAYWRQRPDPLPAPETWSRERADRPSGVSAHVAARAMAREARELRGH